MLAYWSDRDSQSLGIFERSALFSITINFLGRNYLIFYEGAREIRDDTDYNFECVSCATSCVVCVVCLLSSLVWCVLCVCYLLWCV